MPIKRSVGAFTLIELLVVIAIIAILAAILFPVFAQAKAAAKKTRCLAQMKQLGTAVVLYAGDYDDFFVPASQRLNADDPNKVIWPPLVNVYAKNTEIFLVPGSDATFASSWSTRKNQNIGYSDATGVQIDSTVVAGAAPAGTEGFPSPANFSQASEAAKVGLFAITPNSTSGKERGYVFNPYNGPDAPDGTYENGLPLISDVNLCTTVNYQGDDYTGREPGALKPIQAVLGSNGKDEGQTPVIFADGHAKAYSARALNTFGLVIWRFR